MRKLSKVELVTNYTSSAWYTHFPDYSQAPLTLAYDPLLKITNLESGLCHIAHSYGMGEELSDNPDDRILIINKRDDHFYIASDYSQKMGLEKLPALNCILFISGQDGQNVDRILDRLSPNGVAIVVDNCIDLSLWPTLDIQTDLEELKSIQWMQAYIKP